MKNDSQGGFALLYAMGLCLVAAMLCSAMLTYSIATDKVATTKHLQTRASYLAEGAVEAGRKLLQEAAANWREPPVEATVNIGGLPASCALNAMEGSTTRTDPSGIQTLVDIWRLDAHAVVRGYAANAHRIVRVESTPIFQFAIFYASDLEILPGPNMTIGGRIHCNGDVYLGSGATLRVNTNYFRAVGGIFRNRKNDPSTSSGTVLVRRWVEDPFDPSEPAEYFRMNSKSQMGSVPSASGYDARFTSGWDENGDGDFDDPGDWLPWAPGALAYWSQPDGYGGPSGHTIASSDHGVTEAVPPALGSVAMFEEDAGGDHVWNASLGRFVAVSPGSGTHSKGFFHRTADLSIITYADGSWAAFDGDGHDVSTQLGAAVQMRSMYDARQAGGASSEIGLTEIDMDLLAQSGCFPANGVLYAARYGEGEGLAAGGIRLVHGAELAAPLTVVSEDPVYVQGDYNTENKKGAAVIADAVNLLSNAWDDSKTRGHLPAAAETTFNLAMVTGNDETTPGAYNGGFENLPRFHENWNGVACNITGSFVNLWESRFATGSWSYGGDRYTAPRRNWNYDSDFNNVANLPPFTPMAVSAVDIVSW